MSTITTRAGKGSPLTNNEVDANFTNLNTDKAELSGAAFTGAITTTSTVDGRDVSTDGSKLDTVESNADVTDTANVTAAGALMDSELTSIASVKALNQGVATGDSPTFAALTSTGEITANGGIALGDSDKAIFGAGSDLQIYHDGSNSYIDETATGHLFIRSNGDGIYLRSSTNEEIAHFNVNGSVKAYYDNSLKLATTSTGIDVTGTVDTSLDLLVGGAVAGNAGTRTINVGTAGSVAGGVQIWAANNQTSFLQFGDDSTTSANNYRGYMSYNHTNDSMALGTASATKVTIDSSGRVGIGRVPSISNSKLEVGGADNVSLINVEASGVTGGMGIGSTGLQFFHGSTARMRIDSSGNVGIGNAVASSMNAGANQLVVGSGSAGQGITLYSSTSTAGSIHFADGTSGSEAYRGQLVYNHNGDYMAMYTAATERMRIDSSGDLIKTGGVIKGERGTASAPAYSFSDDTDTGMFNISNADLGFAVGGSERMRIDSSGDLIVGGTSSGANDAVSISNSGYIQAIVNGDTVGYFNRRTSDGEILRFQKDGTTVGSIGVLNSNNLTITGSVADHGGLQFATHSIVPMEAGVDSSGTIDLGSSASRFKDLYLSGTAKSQAVELEDIKAKDTNGLNLQTSDGQKRVILDNSGNLLVGKTTTGVAGAGTVIRAGGELFVTRAGDVMNLNRLTSDGEILVFRKDGVSVGSISTNANSLPSDRNFKKNITDLTLGLDFVKSLSPKTYNFKIDDEGQAVMAGLIAQEVEESLTAAGVERNSMTLLQHEPTEDVKESDYKMDYVKFVPVLINAIKEQQTLIESLTARIAALEE